MIGHAHSLGKIVEDSTLLKQVCKWDLQFGDLVLIKTRNSVYSVYVLDNDSYLVSGGWFDRKGLSPLKMRINGCTWGGSIIKIDALAACGLCLEFGNRVVTTAIQRVSVLRGEGKN
jgi:hypothetical protein